MTKSIQYQNKSGDIINADIIYEENKNIIDGYVESVELIITDIINVFVNDEIVVETKELIKEIKEKFEI